MLIPTRVKAVVGVVLAAAALAACVPSLPGRPATLDQLGVRNGADWLEKSLFYEEAQLGSVTQVVRRGDGGEIVVVGTQGAAFLTPKRSPRRLVVFAERAGRAELLEWQAGEPRFLDSGGGGWQTGALLSPDGERLWQPSAGVGMNDLSAGDVDGDGVPELAVGYNGSGGIRLYDASGAQRWAEIDGNVWHVEIVDTDGDGKPEILHSNASGELTRRDASGKVLGRKGVEPYLSQFSVVEWPPSRMGLLHSVDDGTNVLEFDGAIRTHLKTPDTSALSDAVGAVTRLGGENHLVIASTSASWDRTQIFVFDEKGALRFREVAPAECATIATPEENSFLLGCGSRVLRYARTTTGAAKDKR